MSSEPSRLSPEETRTMVSALQALHQRLLENAQRLLVAVDCPSESGTSGADVRGHMARLGPGPLGESEREALAARLRTDIGTLQQLTETLEQLRLAGERPPEPGP
jgi:hypothetical protein